jgi:Protein of unknown function (DUF3224)
VRHTYDEQVTTLATKLEIKSWDEQPYQEFDDGRKLTKAAVTLAGSGDEITSASFDAVLFYRPDGASEYVSIMLVNASLGGEAGSFALRGSGDYDGTRAASEFEIVEGSGTGGCAGITGTATSVSTHEDYPNMPITFKYEL